MADVEQLIDAFITQAQIANGAPAVWMEAQGRTMRGVAGPSAAREKPQIARWTKPEEAFILQNRSSLSLEEIGARLGRSANAIKVHGYRIQAATPRHAPGYVSGNQIAKLLGVDSHCPPAWMERGLLEGEVIPYNQSRVWRRTTWATFLLFLIRPSSWVYFKVERIRNDQLRRLVELAQQKWGDQWLSTRQAADLRGCDPDAIQGAILRGRLHGYQPGSLDRKRTWRWAHWFVKRSEVERLTLPWGCKDGHSIRWSPRADAFIMRAYRENIAYEDMARMMKWTVKRIAYRVTLLLRQGLIDKKKTRGQVSGRISERICSVCGNKPTTVRGQTCGSTECLHELHRQASKLQYQKTHPNYGMPSGIRKPYAKRVKPPRPEKLPKPIKMCEICGIRTAKPKGKFCSAPECKAERIRRYGRAAYQRKKIREEV